MTGSVSVFLGKRLIILAAVVSFVAVFVWGPVSQAAATINYGQEAAAVAKRYVGAPYQYGGNSPKGFDASGFTQYVYKTASAKLSIPRTSAQQFQLGKAVEVKDLKEGDLVFYATGKKGIPSFVGIYIGKNEFAGATSKGVKMIKRSHPYWKTKYVGAKRIVE